MSEALLGVAVLGSVLFGATTAFGSIASSPPPDAPFKSMRAISSIHGTNCHHRAIGDYGRTLSITATGKPLPAATT